MFAIRTLLILAIATTPAWPQSPESPEQASARELQEAHKAWEAAGRPPHNSPIGETFYLAARHEGRMDLIERLLAGGDVQKKMLRFGNTTRRVPLHIVRTFRQFEAHLDDEMFASMRDPEHGWLARRITSNRIEVWTPKRGWLFDGTGRLLQEARPLRREGHGREWYGAFLPDGQWVTTDIHNMDGKLYFFSAGGKLRRTVACDVLARPDRDYSKLIGWARSDKSGTGWVVNLGSENGWATVQVGPRGPARVLEGYERWQLCYPRALGPRGMYLALSVPDDQARHEISRSEASHGPGVGYPDYTFYPGNRTTQTQDSPSVIVPNGNLVFGFWPRSQISFIGSDGSNADTLRAFGNAPVNLRDYEPSGTRTRKHQHYIGDDPPTPIIDKSWIFDAHGKLLAWIRARRIGDAADGRSLLFRATADSRIITLDPNLKVRAIRRMTWPDGSTADAIFLWDDLRLGLFIRHERLVMARWDAK